NKYIKTNKTYHIHLSGIVQGVGFRPMLYNYATLHNLKGYVCNTADGLHFEFNAHEKQAHEVFSQIQAQAPTASIINKATLHQITYKEYIDFSIIAGNEIDVKSVLLTPDYATCKQCKQDVIDKNNSRYRYPFTTCTVCGPRYSILKDLPFDRINTTMKPFVLCYKCKNEYDDLNNRRYFAQTISCNVCGVQMQVFNNKKENICNGNESTLEFILKKLSNGKILAIKGVGGYLLVCDASNAQAISTLRYRKKRPNKPFAIMVKDLQQAQLYANIQPKEKELLESPIAPIVILKSIQSELALNEIAPNLNSIGIMLSYTPLFDIILQDFGKPIVATSGNISGSPIIYKNEDAIEKLSLFADFIITNNREILIPQDDSVVILSPKSKQQIILRRSRGLAPIYFNNKDFSKNYVGTGAMLKSSFTILANNN
ncbi:MAG: Sua5/YciO/YrdC/YwlC family protein, partial [Sediminibacterium sp.]|nr:Sua5/YciO/YrdC/YwlC family protein [Sediminibacterium sp.]